MKFITSSSWQSKSVTNDCHQWLSVVTLHYVIPGSVWNSLSTASPGAWWRVTCHVWWHHVSHVMSGDMTCDMCHLSLVAAEPLLLWLSVIRGGGWCWVPPVPGLVPVPVLTRTFLWYISRLVREVCQRELKKNTKQLNFLTLALGLERNPPYL